MKGHEYRDLIAAYVLANFSGHGLRVYKEVPLGTSIIGKRRRVDVFVLGPSNRALAIECKHQTSSGTTDEKIPYALQDLASMWIPGCLAYGGTGWSAGVLHTLESSRVAARCEPESSLKRSSTTEELDHVIASVFGLWEEVISEKRRVVLNQQLELIDAPLARAKAAPKRAATKKSAG